MTDTVVITRNGAWSEVRIAREEKRNAVDGATRRGLLNAFEELRGEARCIILTGTGSSFCAGMDLKEAQLEQASGGNSGGAEWISVNLAIRRHPAIFIAAVNGVALGGGSTLINICDLAIASQAASIGCPEIGFAMYPAMAGPAAQLSGLTRKQAAWLVLTANRIDGATAAAWGMVNECVEPDRLLPRARELAAQIAQYDAIALAESKKALDLIPALITDWEIAMDQGLAINNRMRSRTSGQAGGLERFARSKVGPV